VLNEGGLFGERAGWHLPGFDTSSWVERDISAGLPDGAAGVGFFVTTFPLDIPAGFDVMLSFTFDESSQPYRALLFVNGWMMGKRVANLGCAIFIKIVYVREAGRCQPYTAHIALNSSFLYTRVSWTTTEPSAPFLGSYVYPR
jgi:hypothetical protein